MKLKFYILQHRGVKNVFNLILFDLLRAPFYKNTLQKSLQKSWVLNYPLYIV